MKKLFVSILCLGVAMAIQDSFAQAERPAANKKIDLELRVQMLDLPGVVGVAGSGLCLEATSGGENQKRCFTVFVEDEARAKFYKKILREDLECADKLEVLVGGEVTH